jgi:hypothetical protein
VILWRILSWPATLLQYQQPLDSFPLLLRTHFGNSHLWDSKFPLQFRSCKEDET